MTNRNLITSKIVEAGGKLRVRSALNPILWLCAIVSMPCAMALAFSERQSYWLVVLALFPVATALFGFVFLLFVDRDKLQSEDYQIRKQSLELIEEKGDLGPTVIESIELIANPEQLPPSTGGQSEP